MSVVTPDPDRVPPARRLAVIGALAAVAVAAVALALTRDASAADRSSEQPLVAVPSAGADSATWFCAAGSGTKDGPDETLVLANVGERPAVATITVYSGASGAVAGTRRVDVAARTQVRLRVAEVAPVAEPAVTVEARGGQLIVEHVLAAHDDVAAQPCARRGSSAWYLPNGTTAKGYAQFLVLFNPYPDEAVADLTFFTEEGVKRPEDLSGLSVPAHARVTIAVHDELRRNDVTAARVVMRTGRVVAERLTLADGSEAARGIGLALGLPALGTEFSIPEAVRTDGLTDRVVVMNPSDQETTVEATVQLRSELSFSPTPTLVAARSAVALRLPEGLPADAPYSLHVRVTGAQPVALGQSVVSTAPGRWIADVEGNGVRARRWAVAAARLDGADSVVVENPGPRPARVSVAAVGGGRGPDERDHFDVAPGRSVEVPLEAPAVAAADSVIVRSDVGVTVFRIGRGGATRSAAVPFVE